VKQSLSVNNTGKAPKKLDVDLTVWWDKSIYYIMGGIVVILIMLIWGYFFLDNRKTDQKSIEQIYELVQDWNTNWLEWDVLALIKDYPWDKTYLVAASYYVQMGRWEEAVKYFELVDDKDLNVQVALFSAYAYSEKIINAEELSSKISLEIEDIKTWDEDGYTAYYYYSIRWYLDEQYFLEYKNIDFLETTILNYKNAVSYQSDKDLSDKINQLQTEYDKLTDN